MVHLKVPDTQEMDKDTKEIGNWTSWINEKNQVFVKGCRYENH